MDGPAFRVAFVVGSVVALTAALAGPAAAYDQTPPQLTVQIRPSFVVGSEVGRYLSAPSDGTVEYATNILEHLVWSATDDVAVCSYGLDTLFAGAPPEGVFGESPQTEFTTAATDYDGDFGGGSFVITGYAITARDCSGAATTRVVASRVGVTQENGSTAYEEAPGSVAYSGTWGVTNCDCFLWGQTRRTSQQWAYVRYTRTYEPGDHIAIVMAKGPGRGQARILVDGTLVKTIDTYAATNTNRIVVFERAMSAGRTPCG